MPLATLDLLARIKALRVERSPLLWMARPSCYSSMGATELDQKGNQMGIAVLGIDLGKNTCSVVGLDASGQVVLRRRMQRNSVVTLAAKLSPCIVAMEACCGAHHLGRLLAVLLRKGTRCA